MSETQRQEHVTDTATREVLEYYTALAPEQRDLPGGAVLRAPDTPILGMNAAYVNSNADLPSLLPHLTGNPRLIASPEPVEGALEVARVHVGTYQPHDTTGEVVAEQVSRLHMSVFADVLTRSWEVPEWATGVAVTLGAALEHHRDFVLLLAYDHSQAVGGLLTLGHAAHLWGAPTPNVLIALLNAAATACGGSCRTSLLTEHLAFITLHDARPLSFSLLGAADQDLRR